MRRILPAVALVLMASPAMAERIASAPFDAYPWPVIDERYNGYSCSVQYIAPTGPGALTPVTVVARAGSRALQRTTYSFGRGAVSFSLTGSCDGACHNFVCIFDLPASLPKASWRASACISNFEAQAGDQTTAVCIPAN